MRQTRRGSTPLHIAVDDGYEGKRDLKLLELLLEEGADATAKNNEGKTPQALAKEKQKTLLEKSSPRQRRKYYLSQEEITAMIDLLTRDSDD